MGKAEVDKFGIKGLNNKNKRFVVALYFVNCIIINKITCAINNRPALINLNTLKGMTRMAKNDISAGINQAVGKRDMIGLRGDNPNLVSNDWKRLKKVFFLVWRISSKSLFARSL